MGLSKEEQNKTLEELKNDYSQFEGISFSIDNVKKKLDEFLDKHNNPTKEELVNARNKFIAYETVFSTRFSVYDQPKGTQDPITYKASVDPQSFEELRYFLTLNTENLAGELAAYQIKYGPTKDIREFKTQMTKEYALKNEKQDFVKQQYLFDHHGDPVFKGLFDIKTDGSLLPQEVPYTSGPKKNLYKEWQEQTDRIVINNPPEKKLQDNLVKYVIMGELLTKKNATRALYGENFGGSTPSTFFSDLNNFSVFLFDSAMKIDYDARMNIHGFRKFIPEIRNEANKKLAGDSIQPIKENLRNSFNQIIYNAGSPSNINNTIWYAQAKMLKEIVEGTKGTEYDLNLSEIEKQKYDLCMKKFDFLNEYRKSKKEMIDIVHDYVESKGTNPQLDPLENPQLFEKIINYETKNIMFNSLNNESSDYNTSILDQSPENIKNEKILNKPILPVEKLFLTDIHKFEKDCRSFVLNSNKLSDLTKATTFEDRLKLLHPQSSGSPGIEIAVTRISTDYADIYEKEIAALRLNEFKKQTAETIEKVDTLQNRSIEERKEFKNKLNELYKGIDTVLSEREPMMKDISPDNLNELIPIYDKYNKKVNDVYRFIVDNSISQFPDYINSCSREIFYSENRKETFEKTCNAYLHNLDFLNHPSKEEPKPETITLTEQALPEFISKLKSVSPETANGPDSLIGNLEELNNSLNLLRSSEKDAKGVSPVFSETADKFMACKAKLNNIMESNNASAKFITGSFLKTMNNDEFIFGASAESKKTSDVLYEKRKAESLNPEEQKKRFNKITSEMDKVSSRFGGNSKEFSDMFRLAKKLNSQKINREEHYKIVEQLQAATEEYISKKSTVPHTEKGKKRLELAKELRDLCRSDLSVKSKDLEIITNKKEATPYSQKDEIRIRKQSCIEQISGHIKNDIKAVASYKLSEFVYLNKLEKLASKGVDIKDKMSLKNINTVANRLMPITDKIIDKNAKKDLLTILNGKNPQKGLLELFEKEKAPEVIDVVHPKPVTNNQPQFSI